MATSGARAALDSWLVQAEAVLRGSDELDTCQDCEDECFEGGDAA